VLQKYLGTAYNVQNFGVSSRTVLKKGKEFDGEPRSYWDTQKYIDACAFLPDIVVIKLGTNDSKPINWDNIRDEFAGDYTDLINSFKNLSSAPKVYACYPIPLFGHNNWVNPRSDAVIKDEMIPLINQAVEATGVEIIDLHTPFVGLDYLADDKVHPNEQGKMLLAHLVAEAICPECNIEPLPTGFFIHLSTFDMGDKAVNTSSSIGNLDISPVLDNDFTTGIEVPFSPEMVFTIELPAAVKIPAYSLTSGSYDVANTPKSWRLEGSNNGTIWLEIQAQNDIVFMQNETKIFDLLSLQYSSMKAYSKYRIIFSENNGGENLAFTEWQLHGSENTLNTSVLNNGGKLTAQYNTVTNEAVSNLTDRKVITKYCTEVSGKNWWVIYNSPVPVKVGKYSLTSGNDFPERDPVSWTLSGSNDGNQWNVLDTRNNQLFVGRYSTMEFEIQDKQNEYQFFRMLFTKVRSGNFFQLSEWQLFKYQEEDTGIETPKSYGLNIYTNQNDLIIQSKADYNSDYEIFTLSGQSVLKGTVPSGSTVLKKMAQGSYLVTIQEENRKAVKKIRIF